MSCLLVIALSATLCWLWQDKGGHSHHWHLFVTSRCHSLSRDVVPSSYSMDGMFDNSPVIERHAVSSFCNVGLLHLPLCFPQVCFMWIVVSYKSFIRSHSVCLLILSSNNMQCISSVVCALSVCQGHQIASNLCTLLLPRAGVISNICGFLAIKPHIGSSLGVLVSLCHSSIQCGQSVPRLHHSNHCFSSALSPVASKFLICFCDICMLISCQACLWSHISQSRNVSGVFLNCTQVNHLSYNLLYPVYQMWNFWTCFPCGPRIHFSSTMQLISNLGCMSKCSRWNGFFRRLSPNLAGDGWYTLR